MDAFLPIIVIFAILIVLKTFLEQLPEKSKATTYNKIPHLLSKAEISFYGVLLHAVKTDYMVFPKIRIADVLKPDKGLNRKQWTAAFNRISAKHFDFVLCDPKTLKIKAVVELNDKSHATPARKKRDDFLRTICEKAELPLHEIPAKRTYSIEDIRQIVTFNTTN